MKLQPTQRVSKIVGSVRFHHTGYDAWQWLPSFVEGTLQPQWDNVIFLLTLHQTVQEENLCTKLTSLLPHFGTPGKVHSDGDVYRSLWILLWPTETVLPTRDEVSRKTDASISLHVLQSQCSSTCLCTKVTHPSQGEGQTQWFANIYPTGFLGGAPQGTQRVHVQEDQCSNIQGPCCNKPEIWTCPHLPLCGCQWGFAFCPTWPDYHQGSTLRTCHLCYPPGWSLCMKKHALTFWQEVALLLHGTFKQVTQHSHCNDDYDYWTMCDEDSLNPQTVPSVVIML